MTFVKLGRQNLGGEAAVFFSGQNPPENKNGRLMAAGVERLRDEENNGAYFLTKPLNGLAKRRDRRTLLRLVTRFPFFSEDGGDKSVGGSWRATKGRPRVIKSVENSHGEYSWQDVLMIVSPGDEVSVLADPPYSKSFMLFYQNGRLVCREVGVFMKFKNLPPLKKQARRRLKLSDLFV